METMLVKKIYIGFVHKKQQRALMEKRFGWGIRVVTIMGAVFFASCSDTDSSKSGMGVNTDESTESLNLCTLENEGNVKYVNLEDAYYRCHDEVWEKIEEGFSSSAVEENLSSNVNSKLASSSSAKQLISNANEKISSSVTKDKSSSSQKAVSSSSVNKEKSSSSTKVTSSSSQKAISSSSVIEEKSSSSN